MKNKYNNLFYETDVAFKDGVIFHGQPILSPDSKHVCQYEVGDEMEQYLNQLLRVIFIGKDTPDDDEYDLRAQSLRKDVDGIVTVRHAVLKNCCRWHYAITELIESNKEVIFSPDDNFLNAARECWESRYVARINLKKDNGGKTCNESQMKRYLQDESHVDLLKNQLLMLNPNVIVLMDGDWTVGRELIRSTFDSERWHDADGEADGIWIRYTDKRLLIQVYHPSCRGNDEDKYNMLVKRFSSFIKMHQDIKTAIFA